MTAEQTAPARSLAVTLTLDDYYAFQKELSRAALRALPSEKPLLAGLWLLLIVLFFALFNMRAVVGRDLIVFAVTCLLLWGVAQFFLRRVRTRLAPATDGTQLGDLRIELSEPRLRIVSRHYETLMSWSAVRELRETPTHLFLMTDHASGYILPKRFLGDDAAIWALRSLLAQRITMGRASAASALPLPS
jgi:YcxB-like protein